MSSSHAKQSQQWRIFYIRTAVTRCHAQGKEFFAISRIKQGNIWHNWKWNIIWWYLSHSFLFQEDYCCLEHRILNMKTALVPLALVLWFVCTCAFAKPFPKIVPIAKLDILMNFVVKSKGYLVVYAYGLSLIFLSSWTCVLGSHFLCWISGLVPFSTWFISSWEKNNCCYKLSTWPQWPI